ncbi:T9SS type B sorting domain-containing protein [Salinimicrobium tongyeongense]|uniref:T9SS type B sorting domain-containing protein n=1 Tax=Salinimicrobium tongyeongense TaxID=2809707 RepID=A0ABY6NMZ4_9FLAO|nr:T9SS type B sorting domain-containing protein [Salinimicrobium tongyeongense]UZH54257.1 T9SS type B sorting domain-containing protein [Salinimicrobium tongyeongense]
MKVFSFLVFLLFAGNAFSQLGFCPGSKGDAIFHEDFSSGTLPAGTTSYPRVSGDPQDGYYTISGTIGQGIQDWHSSLPNTTLSNGNALIVNADDKNAGLFFRREISGLCEATTYEFSAYLMNILSPARTSCANGGIPINVKFQIWDKTDTFLLAEGDTGDIHSSNSPYWEQFALTFQSQAGQDLVILKMYNNGIGGCGNDLAIDDIIFRSCGDLTKVTSAATPGSTLEVCEPAAPVSVQLTATPDHSVYNTHAFQWQESFDESNWQDIPGQTNNVYTSPQIHTTRYYRVKVAESSVNLNSNLCSSVSEPFAVNIVKTPLAPVSGGNKKICDGEAFPSLVVSTANDELVTWYNSATGGVEVATGNTFVPAAAGTYYAEAAKTGFNCIPGPRTPVTLQVFPAPQPKHETLLLCTGSPTQLAATPGNFTYTWSTGAVGMTISVTQPGNYSVSLTNSNGCSAVSTFEVTAVNLAEISKVTSEASSVIIKTANPGEFEFSLDGVNFQQSNIFQNIPGGIYTAYVRDLEGCKTVSEEFPHLVVPQFITPNSDGFNDSFELKGVEYFSSSEIRIFDRYGKLLAAGSGATFSWNGLHNGKELPSEDYWYQIFIEGFEPVKGHFSLKR